jgi:hypothetical protein
MTKRRLLVVTFAYQPSPAVEALRWSVMTKYLERLGHEVTVVTSSTYGSVPGEDLARVIRTSDIGSIGVLRRLLRRPRLPAVGEAASVDTAPPRLLTSVLVPDAKVLSWAPFALRAARRVVRERGIDCVISTSPPESTHLVGLALRRLGPAWLADFRDGWVFETTRTPFPTRLQRALDERLETLVVGRADATVSVTDELVADLRQRLGADAVCIPNGWDADLERDVQETEDAHGIHRRPRLVYTGSLGIGTHRRSRTETFLRTFARFAASADEPPLELVIAGRTSRSDLDLLSSLNSGDTITHVGLLPRHEAHRLQRSADALLLIGSDRSVATAKLYEYMGARRPILHVGEPSAASRILAETGSGVIVRDDDVHAIVRELRRIASGDFGSELAPRGIERYSYPFLAEQMAEAVEAAIRWRAG